jgi:hypothetical protein
MTGSGLPVTIVVTSPIATDARSTKTDTILTFGTVVSLSLQLVVRSAEAGFAALLERPDEIVRGKSLSICVRQDTRRERLEPTRVLVRRTDIECAHPDKRSNAPAGLKDAAALEVGVHTGDRVRVDA